MLPWFFPLWVEIFCIARPPLFMRIVDCWLLKELCYVPPRLGLLFTVPPWLLTAPPVYDYLDPLGALVLLDECCLLNSDAGGF